MCKGVVIWRNRSISLVYHVVLVGRLARELGYVNWDPQWIYNAWFRALQHVSSTVTGRYRVRKQ